MTDNQPPKSTLPNYRWIKFAIDHLDDPEFMQLTDGALGEYIKFYLMAGKADAGGLLCNSNKVYTAKDLAWYLRRDQAIIDAHLAELCSAELLTPDGEGYRLTRFLEEQGPGDNAMRLEWRDRQNKHRARARKEPEPEKEKEAEKEVEVDIDIESHGDVTVTQPPQPPQPPPPSATSSPKNKEPSTDEEIFQNYWKAYTEKKLAPKKKVVEFFKVIDQEGLDDWSGRLRDCLIVWKAIVEEDHKEGNWALSNPDAVMELYKIPNLEDRMQREGRTWKDKRKEQQRKDTLRAHGRLQE